MSGVPYEYQVCVFTGGFDRATKELNRGAANGWEPCMQSSYASPAGPGVLVITFRRPKQTA